MDSRTAVVTVVLQIDKVLLEKANLYGIDLKTFIEVKLYEYITGREQFHNSKPLKYGEIREDFEKWLKSRISEDTADRYLNILENLDENSPEALINLYQKRPANNVSKAIRNLVDYLLKKELIDERTANKIKKELPIKRGKGDKVIPTDQDIKEAFEYFREHLSDDYYLVALILLHSGARLEHVVKMLNEWNLKYLEVKNGFARYEIHHLAEGFKEGLCLRG
ncbi:integrase [Archaeoglobus sp.]